MTHFGLLFGLVKFRTPRGYQVETIANAKAFELMHEHRHPPANDNVKDAA